MTKKSIFRPTTKVCNMGDRLKRMEYKIHSYDKIKTYNPKIRDYKVHLEPKKPERYKLPENRKINNDTYKIKDYKMKEYRYKEYVPPWERGEVRKKKMKAVARFLPKKPKEPPKQPPPPAKTEPKPKPKPEPKPKPVPPPPVERKVKPEPKPPPPPPPPAPVRRPEPARKPEIPKKAMRDEVTQTTPPKPMIPEPPLPVPVRQRYEETEVMYPPIDFERRKRTETEAKVFVNDRPPPTPDLPLFKPTYSPVPKGGTTYNRRLHSPRNVLENLNF
ncbi:protein TsetseEP-like [Gigantopelta aegis]|uniref:protein TsetseEP-like n=1 Tax=Gigantopelta aegis TaxID=1735272 RepID=UPI001B887E63|nr:protein TsetseEP-like [Gigantopelta aegis]